MPELCRLALDRKSHKDRDGDRHFLNGVATDLLSTGSEHRSGLAVARVARTVRGRGFHAASFAIAEGDRCRQRGRELLMAEKVVEEVGRHLRAAPAWIGDEDRLHRRIGDHRTCHAEFRLVATQTIRSPAFTIMISVDARAQVDDGRSASGRATVRIAAVEAAFERCCCQHQAPHAAVELRPHRHPC